ncbi:MAG TPA: LLM class flavin-dependent oxidoreductase [Candidatus Binataceae bacterium]|nr:LLM class flavin-dependent oxidoreductase [Candidatus Binataceae bacterium]
MKFAHFSHVWGKAALTPATRYEQLWRELEICDHLGFDYSFCVEHHFGPLESWMPTPAVYCASVAARTRRLRPGPMGYVAGLYDPIRIAEEIAVLDNLSGGRLEVGMVSGIVPSYFAGYGADFARRKEHLAEAVALLKAATTRDAPFDFEGPFHRYHNLTLSVQPLQKPHPPLWISSRDPELVPWMARNGINATYVFLFPRQEAAHRYAGFLRDWRNAGHARPPRIGYWAMVYVDETDERAVALARPQVVEAGRRFLHAEPFDVPFEEQHRKLADFFDRRGEPGEAEIFRNLLEFDYLFKRDLVFVGAPDTVAAKIRAAAAEGSFNTLFCEFNFGDLAERDLLRSIRLFGEQVMPALRSYEPF